MDSKPIRHFDVNGNPRPYYDRAYRALQAAHDACFNHPDRDVLGMSHGPFSGVNEVLGIITELESKLAGRGSGGRD